MKKIKILMLSKNFIINGISSVILNYCRNMDKNKFDITIMTGENIDKKNLEECKKLGINFIQAPTKNKKNIYKYYNFVNKIIKKEQYDIVHIHGNSASICIELLIAKFNKVNARIVHSHNTTCNNKFVHYVLRPFMNQLCTGKFACGMEAGIWMYGKKQKFIVIPNGNDFNLFKFDKEKRSKLRKKYNVNDKIIIGHVGLFNYQKNHEFIIEIFDNLLKKHKNKYLLCLIGDGVKKTEIEEKVKQCNIEENVIFTGTIGKEEISNWLSAMDIMVLPSRFEGFPNVLVEWQISGLPCIVSDKVTKDVAITDLVEFESIESNVDKWIEKIENIELKKRELSSENIHNMLIEHKLDINENVKFVEKIYENLLKRKVGVYSNE